MGQQNADIILFNACSVREKPQEKVFHDPGRARKPKVGAGGTAEVGQQEPFSGPATSFWFSAGAVGSKLT
ncbi:MAG: hypothetical protein Q8J72_12930 [Rhodocyclaceae bacterium]|nr:hypothetical protein [Rhodocyclaceae bacterium]